MTDERRCPACGMTQAEHAQMQEFVNKIRQEYGQKPLDPPDIQTGYQRR